MEFKFSVNELFKSPIVEIDHTLIPPGFTGDRRSFWDVVGKVSKLINAMGEASATAQGLTKPITTAERLRNSEQKIYFLIDQNAGNGRGAVTGMLKIGQKGLYVFDRNGQHYQVSPLCVLDFYIHESRQRTGLGKRLFEHMLQNENVEPVKMAIDRPSEKFLGFLNKHYSLNNPVKQMNNYVVFDGFFPSTPEKNGTVDVSHSGGTPGKKQSANGLQTTSYTSPLGRYGAPRPHCSMGQIIHNQTSTMPKNPEPTGVVSVRSTPETTYHAMTRNSPPNPTNISQSAPNLPHQPVQQQHNVGMVQMQTPQYQTQGNNEDNNNLNKYQPQQQSDGVPDLNTVNQYQQNMRVNNLPQQNANSYTGQYQNNMQNEYLNQSGESISQEQHVTPDQGRMMYQNTSHFANPGIQNPNSIPNQEIQTPQIQSAVPSANIVQHSSRLATNPGPYVQQNVESPYTAPMPSNTKPQHQMMMQNNTPNGHNYLQQNAVDNQRLQSSAYQQTLNAGPANYMQANPQLDQQNYYRQEQPSASPMNNINNFQNQQTIPQNSYQAQTEHNLSSTHSGQNLLQNTQSYVGNTTRQQPHVIQSTPRNNASYNNESQHELPYNTSHIVQSGDRTMPQFNNQTQPEPNVTRSVPNANIPYTQTQQAYNITNQMSQPNMNPGMMPHFNNQIVTHYPQNNTQQSLSQSVITNAIERNDTQQYNQMNTVNPSNIHPLETKTTMSQPNTNAMNEKNMVQQHLNQTIINQTQNMKETLPQQNISSAPYARPQSDSINQNATYPEVPQYMEGNQLGEPSAVAETRVHNAKGDMPSTENEELMLKYGYPPQVPKTLRNTRPYVLSVPGR